MSDMSTARPTILPSDPAPIVPAAPSDPLMDALSALESRVNTLEAKLAAQAPGDLSRVEAAINTAAKRGDEWAREQIGKLAGHLGIAL